MNQYEVETREFEEVFTAVVYGEVGHDDLPAFLDQALPEAAAYLQKVGVGPDGPAFARYTDAGEGRWEVEAGFPATTPVGGQGNVEPSELPACTAAVVTHVGPYDGLEAAHQALRQWLADQGRTADGGPWEVYLTDPGENPDSSTWRTLVVQPLAT